MDGASLAGRTPDRRDFPFGTPGLPRSGGEAGDRPGAGGFPWRATSDCLPGVTTVQLCSPVTSGAGSAAGEVRANDGHQTSRTAPSNLMTRTWASKVGTQRGDHCSVEG